jgi:hypothetical protein
MPDIVTQFYNDSVSNSASVQNITILTNGANEEAVIKDITFTRTSTTKIVVKVGDAEVGYTYGNSVSGHELVGSLTSVVVTIPASSGTVVIRATGIKTTI